jgi:hypothetical protein
MHSFIQFSCLVFFFFTHNIRAQSPLVTYAGGGGKETFYDVLQISDGTFLVAGNAEDLDWVDASVPRTVLSWSGTIPNALGTNRYGILLHFSENLQQLLRVVHFPRGAVEDIRYLKTSSQPYAPTGDLYISCNTSDTEANNGGFLLARLDHNFIDGIPSHLLWQAPVWAESGPKDYHPWDVTNDGRVYYILGQNHAYDWSALYCLNQNGKRMPVEHFRTHWLKNNAGEWRGTPASAYPNGGLDAVDFSGIVLKNWGRCELRSWTADAFNGYYPDGNGGMRKGAWPADFLFKGPCNPASPGGQSPGYNGYSPESCCPVYGGSCVVVDRRNNELYVGMNFKSYSVSASSPDFEPAVMAFSENGALRWWSRLYHEITPDGDTVQSLPDQYIDALAIDYAQDKLVVGARAHGNNVENLWEGDQIDANPAAYGFQNRFTGTNGNIHLSWLGKLRLADGALINATYMGEYAEGTGALGAAHPDPNLDGWPNPNAGWPDVNTTRMARNALKVSSNGEVCVLAVGRRTITTANAYQKMVKPAYGGKSCWNSFVRVYAPDFSVPKYSSLLVGAWDTLTQAGGDNTELFGVYKTAKGVVCVGRRTADAAGVPKGNAIPLANVPVWGTAQAQHESALLAYLTADNLENQGDDITTGLEAPDPAVWSVFPNPATEVLLVKNTALVADLDCWIYSTTGRLVAREKCRDGQLDVRTLPSGMYFLRVPGVPEVSGLRFVKL